MKNYLQLRKEELKKRGVKGFTLMEMLIVVAIIAVLIAIAIPIFTSQLEKSRESTDEANIRALYAECVAAALTQTGTGTTTAVSSVADSNNLTVVNNNGVIEVTGVYTLKQQAAGLEGVAQDGTIDIGGISLKASDFGPSKKATVTAKSDGTATAITIGS